MNIKTQMILKMVERMVVDQNPQLASSTYRKSLPIEAKKNLVKMMYGLAVRLGATPTKPLNI